MAEIDITRIAGNIGAMNALNSLATINKQLSVHQTRLSTGKRINSAADDPAGLTIATKMLSRSEGLKTALDNIGDAKNLLAVAESGMGRVNDILVQMRNKAESAASDTMGQNERAAIVTQLQAYAAQIDDIAEQTEWNGTKLINGDTTALSFQTGAGETDVTDVDGLGNLSATGTGSLSIAAKAADTSATYTGTANADFGTLGLSTTFTGTELATGSYTARITYTTTNGVNSTVDLLDENNTVVATKTGVNLSVADPAVVDFNNGVTMDFAQAGTETVGGTSTRTFDYVQKDSYSMTFNDGTGDKTLTKASTAADFRSYMAYVGDKLDAVSGQLSKIGALTGRLTFKEDQVSAAQINVEAAYNRIMNANMAEEQVNASKFQILQQTSTAMLAQANAAPQFLLSLFQ
jgi:flagellin